MRRLAVGLIGAGKHGQRYAHHIRADVPELALAALCRRDAARGREQARTLGCRFHDEWAAPVAHPAVHAVIAGGPPTLHPAGAPAVTLASTASTWCAGSRDGRWPASGAGWHGWIPPGPRTTSWPCSSSRPAMRSWR